MLYPQIMNELINFKKQQKKKTEKKLLYKGVKAMYDLKIYKTIRSFTDTIRNCKVMIDMEKHENNQLAQKIK